MTTPKAKLADLALIVALCAGFTLGLTAPAWAGFDEGFAAWIRGDYATAIREFRPLAEQGNAKAQFMLGSMYGAGKGVPQDYAKSMHWHRMAAEQDQTGSMHDIGIMYYEGQGVPQDYAEAMRWFLKAGGNRFAQYRLGAMYDKGQGVPQDYAEAAKWYRKAARRGYAIAQGNLGIMYSSGQGVTQDYVQAHMWLNIAASSFPPGEKRDRAVKSRDKVAAKMSPAQISEARKLAREWRPKK